jgi:hypothetical protein
MPAINDVQCHFVGVSLEDDIKAAMYSVGNAPSVGGLNADHGVVGGVTLGNP